MRRRRRKKRIWGRRHDIGQYARGAQLVKANRKRGAGKHSPMYW